MNAFTLFYAIIRRIPKGRVATYGQIARLAGLPRHARQVGYALAALEDDQIPWQRVINSKGEISPRSFPQFVDRQRDRLRKEGVTFNKQGRVSLVKFGWVPRRSY